MKKTIQPFAFLFAGLCVIAGARPSAAAPDCSDPAIVGRGVPECALTAQEREEADAVLRDLAASAEKAGAESKAAAAAEKRIGAERAAAAERVKGALAQADFDGAASHEGEPAPVLAGAPPALAAAEAASEFVAPAAAAAPIDTRGVDCTDPFILARRVSECMGAAGMPAPDAAASAGGEATKAEAMRFWGSQAIFHGAWLGDLFTTMKILSKGGYEMNPIYTLFGAKSMLGVGLSIVAVHVLLTLLLWWLYRRMKQAQGAERRKFGWLAMLVGLLGGAVHLFGAVHNAGVLSHMR